MRTKTNLWLLRPLVMAVSSCFVMPSWANPTGPQVIQGSATIQGLNSKNLNITNSPGAIIHWQGFSIGANEITRFTQQSAASAVLNRVVGADISQIHGQLLSNGRVFLINPAGILIGAGAVIDTAGFVGSTLKMIDADFLAGKLRFEGDARSGSIVNQGWLRTGYGGNIVLVAPRIENSGLIQTPGGELILAAGQKLTIGSLQLEGVQFEIQAPTDSVINVGKLLADGGAVGVFAGTLKHSGDVRANALVRDEAGRIVLKAQGDVTLAEGSTTSASGKTGGDILIQSSAAQTRIAGEVAAKGSAGAGGDIKLLGDTVSVVQGGVVDASGATGGGQIRIGGDYQGANAAIANASRTFVGSNAALRADATESGDGGRIIVWSEQGTQFYGSLSARGGVQSGNGGFAEVSGKENLLFAGRADLGAPNGALGNLLLDPLDTYVFNAGGLISQLVDEATDFPATAITVTPGTLAAVTGNVALYAGRYMRISDPIALTTLGQSLTAQVGTYTPGDPAGSVPNRLDIAANIGTNNGAVALTAPRIESVGSPVITTNGGAITLTSTGATIQAGGLALNAGTGAVNATSSSSLLLGALTGGSVAVTAPGSAIPLTGVATGAITSMGGPVNVSSSAGFVTIGATATGGGSVTANAARTLNTGPMNTGGGAVSLNSNASVNAAGINAGSGNVAVLAPTLTTGVIDTTGAVNLSATAGSIFATVDNAATLNATSTNATGTNINISSNTALNANNVVATATGCFSGFGCPGAFVNLNATGQVNVGTVTASALTSTNNSISESINITSNTGSIRGMSGASRITAADVGLSTGQGSGGGIMGASPLNVDVDRTFTFRPNGTFEVNLVGSGPNRLTLEPGVAPATQTYSGTLTRSGGGITFSASADENTVTVSNLAVQGFNQRVNNFDPFISLRVPNGALSATAITVPEGDTTVPPVPPAGIVTASLPVAISASGDVSIGSYTRQSTPSSLAKSTTISSDTGSVALGTINASRDPVGVFARNNVSVSATTLVTAGNVNINAATGNATIGQIDTTSGAGSVTVSAPQGTVGALIDSVGLEILSGSTVNVTGQAIGTAAFANPLDAAGTAITLNSPNAGARIGSAAGPVVANTQNLTINAANNAGQFITSTGGPFNVSTGLTALRNLTVSANPAGVGAGGLARVRTEVGQPNDTTYNFVSDGANFTMPPGIVPPTQFVNGTFSFTSNAGNIVLGNTNLGTTGALAVTAQSGSITGGGALDGAAITLRAGTSTSGAAVNVTTGNIGANVRPGTVQITSGNSSPQRPGSVLTGTINGDAVSITTFNGNIEVGAGGTADIGSTGTPAGAVMLNADRGAAGASGTIQTRDIFAASIEATSVNNAITTRNLNTSANIDVLSHVGITTGSIDAPSFVVTNDGNIFSPFPQITVGAIGTLTPILTLGLNGQGPAGGIATQVQGPVTGAAGAVLNIHGHRNGAVLLGGPVNAGAGSTINITHRGANPFQFTTLNAGADGTVNLTSFNAIEQTTDTALSGITAATVNLFSSTGPISNTADASGRLDLNTVTRLSTEGAGTMRFDAQGNTLRSLRIVKTGTVTAAPYELANLGSGQVITLSSAPADMTLTAQSPTTPLDFSLTYNSGGMALATGVVTSGGNATLVASGALNATNGGVTTSGGGILLQANGGDLNTGALNTAAGTGPGGPITVNANCVGCNVVVDGNLDTGTGGAFVAINAGGSISRSGTSTIRSDSASSVNIFASDGDIGTAANPMLITTPRANLNARDFTVGGAGGLVFATLSGTTSLDLTGDNGFNVSSDAALQTLTLSTRGSGSGLPGAGTLNLIAPAQTYAFDRPRVDLFGPITNTFQVLTAGGATALTTATFRTSDGDLLITGGAALNTPDLTLGGGGVGNGDIKLQGNAATPLNLAHPTQTVRAPRDLLIRGNVALSSTGTQTLFGDRDLSVQAEGGTIALTASVQDISTRTGSLSFIGGAAADETVTLSASTRQRVSTPENQGGNVLFRGGAGDRAHVNVVYTGPNVANVDEQLIEVRGNINIEGGGGANSDVTIMTATGDQVLRAGNRAEPNNVAIGNIIVVGGGGAGSDARVTNTGTGFQRVGEATCNTGVQGCPDFPYQSRNISVLGGGGVGSIGAVSSTGPQQIYSRNGILTVMGGGGINATATVESTSATDQHIGLPTYLGFGRNQLSGVTIEGGTGTGAAALVTTPAFQRVTASGTLALRGNATGTNAPATLMGMGQDVRVNTINLTGGGGVDSSARIASTGTQTFCGAGFGGVNCTATSTGFGSLTMIAGTAANTFTKIDSTGAQTLRGGSISLTGGGIGDADAQRIANADAIVEGQSQVVAAGNLTMKGGAGRGVEDTSDAMFVNLSGNQQVTAAAVNLTGGHEHSTTGIVNQGTGTQTVTVNSLFMQSDVTNAPAHSNAFVRIQNQAATRQTLTLNAGGVTMQNSGSFDSTPANLPGESLVDITSGGAQDITTRFVDVVTLAGATSTGNTKIFATGNQWIRTTNGGIQVAALGSGEASIRTNATQLLEVDYPGFMQGAGTTGLLNVGRVTQRFAAASAAGNSLVEAVDQTAFAGGIFVQGPSGAAANSRLSSTATQTLSALLTGVQVTGGSGVGSLATIDPTDQTIVGNGGFGVTGGSGTNAIGSIVSQGAQQLVATNSGITLTGGSAPGAAALIETAGPATQLVSAGPITLTPGSAPDADALFITGNGITPGAFTVSCPGGCPTPTLFGADPQGNGVADAGAFGSWNNIPFTALSAAPAAVVASTPNASNDILSEQERVLQPEDRFDDQPEFSRRAARQCT